MHTVLLSELAVPHHTFDIWVLLALPAGVRPLHHHGCLSACPVVLVVQGIHGGHAGHGLCVHHNATALQATRKQPAVMIYPGLLQHWFVPAPKKQQPSNAAQVDMQRPCIPNNRPATAVSMDS